jgi:hypothetical protein
MNYIRRQVLTNGLLLLAAGTSGLVATASIHWPLPSVSTPDSQTLLPQLAHEDPQILTLTRGAQSIRLVHEGGATGNPVWYAESPAHHLGDIASIDAAIAALRELRIVRRISSESAATPDATRNTGLEQPSSTWQFELKKNQWTLRFGARALGFRGGTYVALSDSVHSGTVTYVVEGATAALELTPDQMLEARLVQREPIDVREIMLGSQQGRLHIRLDERRDHWFEVDPPRMRVSRDRVESLLDALTSLRAQRFFGAGTPSTGAKAGAQFTVDLGLVNPASGVEIEFLGKCDSLPGLTLVRVAGASATLACADAKSVTTLLAQAPPDWRDSQLFSLRMDQVESLEASFDSKKFDLRRDGTGFLLEAPTGTSEVDSETGNDFLTALLATGGQIITRDLSSAESVFDSSDLIRLHSSVTGSDENYQEQVLFGARSVDGSRFVRRLEDNAVLKVEPTIAAMLQINSQSLKSRTIIHVDSGQVQHVEVRVGGKKVTVRSEQMDALRECLSDLKAKKWLSARPAANVVQDMTQVDFDIVKADDSIRHHTLRIVSQDDGTEYCWLEEQASYFEALPTFMSVVRNLSDR